MTRIFIADDQAVVREGVKRIIADITDMRVVGESEVSPDMLSQIRAQPLDIVIFGRSALGRRGMEFLHDLRQTQPDVPILVLSGYAEHRDATEAFKAGAKGYLAKASEPEDLIQAIRQVAQGGVYASPALTDYLIRSLSQQAEPPCT